MLAGGKKRNRKGKLFQLTAAVMLMVASAGAAAMAITRPTVSLNSMLFRVRLVTPGSRGCVVQSGSAETYFADSVSARRQC